jgi:hypothetical protein
VRVQVPTWSAYRNRNRNWPVTSKDNVGSRMSGRALSMKGWNFVTHYRRPTFVKGWFRTTSWATLAPVQSGLPKSIKLSY